MTRTLPKVHCLNCGTPGTVLRMGMCARCTANYRWHHGPRFVRVVIDECGAFPDALLAELLEDESEPTEPLPPDAA